MRTPNNRYSVPFHIWGGWLVTVFAAVIGAILGAAFVGRQVLVLRELVQQKQNTIEQQGTTLDDVTKQDQAREAELREAQRQVQNLQQQVSALTQQIQTYRQLVTDAGYNPDQVKMVAAWPFTIRLNGCKRSDVSVRCDLVLTNRSAQKEGLYLNPWYYMGGRVSYFTDPQGNKYEAVAARSIMPPLGDGGPPDLLPNVPQRVGLLFDNVPMSVSGGTLVIELDRGYMGAPMTITIPEVGIGP
jgi:hypothetical protein